jgi:Tol biopolymer transport system component/beta-lactamase regulating signal transducer with metallopeptidase domain
MDRLIALLLDPAHLHWWRDVLFSAAIKSMVILSAVGLCAIFLQRASAAIRHMMWALALGGTLALPLFSVLLPSLPVSLPGSSKLTTIAKDQFAVAVAAEKSQILQGLSATKRTNSSTVVKTEPVPVNRNQLQQTRFSLSWSAMMVGLWALVGALIMASLGLHWARRQRLLRNARLVQEGSWPALVGDLCRKLQLTRSVTLLESAQVAIPMTWGFWRPVVLLPLQAKDWPFIQYRDVLLHELAHIKRGDHLTQLIGQVACALYWFNPLVWVATRRLRIEYERACDDQVLNMGTRPSDYAGHLLEVARSFQGLGGIGQATVALARSSQLADRILAILDEKKSRMPANRRRWLIAWLLIALVVLPLAVASCGEKPAGKIVFTSDRGSSFDIYVMEVDGANPVNLTDHPAEDSEPVWSSDGSKIAFTSDRDGNMEIYAMDSRGANLIRLTSHQASDSSPSWSPDGTKVVFCSNRDGNEEVYRVNLDSSDPVKLTDHPSYDRNPAWSPDGTKIAFASSRGGNWDIYVMDVDGSNLVRLTNDSTQSDSEPAWSPDGTRIAFFSFGFGKGMGLNIIGTDGSDPIPVNTPPFESARHPTWSPDGSKLAFALHDANTEIYMMDADGSNLVNLTQYPAPHGEQAGSPDGTKIAFTSFRGGNGDVYVMDADGSNLVNLSHHPAREDSPAWLPDGTKIVFRSNRDGEWEYYMVETDGSNPVKWSSPPELDRVWSPDRTRIAFTAEYTVEGYTYTDIHVMDADGTNAVNLTNHSDRDSTPAWSPDGTQIAFTSSRNGGAQVYLMNADGSNLVRLTSLSGSIRGGSNPVWSPDGTKIVFSAWTIGFGGSGDIFMMDADGANPINLTKSKKIYGRDPIWLPSADAALGME